MSDYRQELSGVISRIRAQLLAAPGRYSPRTVGITNLIDSQRIWDGAMRDVLADLARGDSSG
jgi:hypothetical protein